MECFCLRPRPAGMRSFINLICSSFGATSFRSSLNLKVIAAPLRHRIAPPLCRRCHCHYPFPMCTPQCIKMWSLQGVGVGHPAEGVLELVGLEGTAGPRAVQDEAQLFQLRGLLLQLQDLLLTGADGVVPDVDLQPQGHPQGRHCRGRGGAACKNR
jgi:hypothetical protein